MRTDEILKFIEKSRSFDEVRNAEVLPEPDQDGGYRFVSYSHKDYKLVFKDVVRYFAAGMKIWYDRFLESGKSWVSEVRKKIVSYFCKSVVFYITRNFLASDSCLAEIECALAEDKSCLFVLCGVSEEQLAETVEKKLSLPFAPVPQKRVLLPTDVSIEEKIATVNALRPPELFEFYFTESHRVFKLFRTGRCAYVRKVNCTNMRTVELPKRVEKDGKIYKVAGLMYNAFCNNDMLEEVTVPDGWNALMDGAFTRCRSLRTLRLGTPHTSRCFKVGTLKNTFVACPNLAEIKRGKGRIGLYGTFKDAQHIQSFDTTGYLLGQDCFSGCVGLTHVTLSQKTRVIHPSAFENCKGLTHITLPASLGCVDATAFRGCENLKEVTVNGKRLLRQRADGGWVAGEKYIYLDDLFPYAEKFYLKKVSKFMPFRNRFAAQPSDKTGYTLFVKQNGN